MSTWTEHQKRWSVAAALLETLPEFQRLDPHTKASVKGAVSAVMAGETLRDGSDPARYAATHNHGIKIDQVEAWVERMHRIARQASAKLAADG